MPSLVGRYRLLGRIGSGGMAHVHLAAATGPLGFAKLVVLKILRPELAEEPETIAMFLDEARLAARLSHPAIVQTFEVGAERGIYYLAMEHLEGQPLHRVIRRFDRDGTLSTSLAIHILVSVLEGLHHAHELLDLDGTSLGVVHRDVSPQNVFVTYDGAVKVVDFGIAKANDTSMETRVGTLKGKLAYMAPEQARGEAVDRRADVFACGALLFEMVTGKRLWEDATDPYIASRLVHGDLPELKSLGGSIPPRLLDVLARALAPRPAERYPTASAMRSDLESIVGATGAHQTARDVASAMGVSFAAERRDFDQRVRDGMVALASEPSSTLRSVVTPIAFGKPTPETDAMPTMFSPSSGALTIATDAARVASPRAPSRLRPWIVGSALVATVGLVVGIVGLVLARPERPASPSVARVASSASASVDDGLDGVARPTVVLAGDIEESTELTNDREYLLENVVFVRSGATLRIAPGTTIRGDFESKGTLVIEPGARLLAEGTVTEPIVFTSERPAAVRAAGDWGGLIVLGNAPTNRTEPTRIEGLLTRGIYGGLDADDDSGAIEYVRIEFAGERIAPNNEINGLTLGGVGRGTRIHHVQVRSPLDDCFEFFGGTVDAHHLICDAPGDDGFDWDQGYTGRLQFLLFRDDVAQDGSNVFEGDSDSGGDARPRSRPVIWNATACAGGGAWQSDAYGVLLRSGTRGLLGGALFIGFGAGVDVRDRPGDSAIVASRFVGDARPLVAYPEGGTDQRRDDDDGFDEVRWLSSSAADVEARSDVPVRWSSSPGEYKPVESIRSEDHAPPNDHVLDTRADFVGAFRDRDDRWDQEPWVVPMAP